MKTVFLILAVMFTAIAEVGIAVAQDGVEKLGRVHFPTSCSAGVQAQFDRAVALLHSFWFQESDKAFAAIAQTDPHCAIAHWGVSMGQRRNPISNVPDAVALRRGGNAVEKAKAIGAKTDRERDYIAAIAVFYQDADTRDHASRSLAYERAMEQVYLRYPGDREAAAFYAVSLLPNEALLSTDKSYAKQLKAGAILEKLFAEQPDHPGAAHYLIHAYDYAALAPRALAAARRYASIAPSSDHARHMPSHIFTRLGLWQESIQSNLAAAAVAEAYARKTGTVARTTHLLHFLMEAYLQGAQDREAKHVLDDLAALREPPTGGVTNDITVVGIPARYALDRRRWAEAASLQPRPSRHPYAEAITHFARALGAARTGDVTQARGDVSKLEALRDSAGRNKQEYWAQQIEIQRRAAAAWLARAEGRNDQALELSRTAAELEEATQEHQTARDAIVPARELLGELLLDLGQAAPALREFETSLAKQPNRFNGFYGAARAAELAGEPAKAKDYYAKLVALCDRADSPRSELGEAKAFLAGAK